MYLIDFIWYLIDIMIMFDSENNAIRSVKINLKLFAPQSTLKLNLLL